MCGCDHADSRLAKEASKALNCTVGKTSSTNRRARAVDRARLRVLYRNQSSNVLTPPQLACHGAPGPQRRPRKRHCQDGQRRDPFFSVHTRRANRLPQFLPQFLPTSCRIRSPPTGQVARSSHEFTAFGPYRVGPVSGLISVRSEVQLLPGPLTQAKAPLTVAVGGTFCFPRASALMPGNGVKRAQPSASR